VLFGCTPIHFCGLRRVNTYTTYSNTTAIAAATTTPALIPILALEVNPELEDADVGAELGKDVEVGIWEVADVDVAVIKVDSVGVIVGVLIVEILDIVAEDVEEVLVGIIISE